MKLVKQLENGNLVWIDTAGFRQPTTEELQAEENRIAKAKEEHDKRKRLRDQIKSLEAELSRL